MREIIQKEMATSRGIFASGFLVCKTEIYLIYIDMILPHTHLPSRFNLNISFPFSPHISMECAITKIEKKVAKKYEKQ